MDGRPTYEQLAHRVAQLEEALARRSHEGKINAALHKISNAVNTTADLDELFATIHHTLGTILDTSNFYIALYEKDDDSVTFPYIVDSVDSRYPPVIAVSKTASLTAEVIRKGLPLLVSKAEILARRAASPYPAPSCTPSEVWLGVPLITLDRLVGVMAVQSYLDPGCYNQADLKVMVAVAEQVALSIERKRMVLALASQRRRLENIIEAARIGTWEWDIESGAIVCNPRWAEIIGYTLEELAPCTIALWRKILHPDDAPVAARLLEQHLAGDLSYYHCECRIQHKNGHWVWILTRGRLITRSPEGKPLLMFGTHTDISARKEAESERQSLQEKLAKARQLESVGQLAGGIAHNFNNMLGVILGYVELVLEQVEESQPIYPALLGVQQAAERSARLTRQLLAYARRQTIAPKVINLNQTLAEMLAMLHRLAGEHIDLVWRPGQELGLVKIDPAQLDQIMVELAVNAREHLGESGQLIMETSNATVDASYQDGHLYAACGEYVLLTVSDTGFGIEPETLSRLFEPFFSSKGIGMGTGLGLATVYGIVKQNNGFINVYSEPGRGTSLKIYLPRYDAATESQLPPDSGASSGPKGTILLVEDQQSILNTVREMLEELGYRVLIAPGPLAAIDLAAEHNNRLDLLMTDVVMPEMNGGELAKKLLAAYPRLRCLFMSGYTANVTVRHGLLEEGVHFLQKPFSTRELAIKLQVIFNGLPA
jgi:two-component system, cell cycle sensor histidine kinase and response regulator CckA